MWIIIMCTQYGSNNWLNMLIRSRWTRKLSCFVTLYHRFIESYIATVILLHKPRSSAASLSSAKFIPDIDLFLLPSPYASIISLSRPFARITRPKSSIFCFAAFFLSDKILLPVLSPTVSIHLFCSQSKKPSASFSRYTSRRRQFSFPVPFSLSMIQFHKVSPERSLHFQIMFLSSSSRVYPSSSSQDLELPL